MSDYGSDDGRQARPRSLRKSAASIQPKSRAQTSAEQKRSENE